MLLLRSLLLLLTRIDPRRESKLHLLRIQYYQVKYLIRQRQQTRFYFHHHRQTMELSVNQNQWMRDEGSK